MTPNGAASDIAPLPDAAYDRLAGWAGLPTFGDARRTLRANVDANRSMILRTLGRVETLATSGFIGAALHVAQSMGIAMLLGHVLFGLFLLGLGVRKLRNRRPAWIAAGVAFGAAIWLAGILLSNVIAWTAYILAATFLAVAFGPTLFVLLLGGPAQLSRSVWRTNDTAWPHGIHAWACAVRWWLPLSLATVFARGLRVYHENPVEGADARLPASDDDDDRVCPHCAGAVRNWPRLSGPLLVVCPSCREPVSTLHPLPSASAAEQAGLGRAEPAETRILVLLADRSRAPSFLHAIGSPTGDGAPLPRVLRIPLAAAGSPPCAATVEFRLIDAGPLWGGDYQAVLVVPPEAPPRNRFADPNDDVDCALGLVELPPAAILPPGRLAGALAGAEQAALAATLLRRNLLVRAMGSWWMRWRRLFIAPLPESHRVWWRTPCPHLAVWQRPIPPGLRHRGRPVVGVAGRDALVSLIAGPGRRDAARAAARPHDTVPDEVAP